MTRNIVLATVLCVPLALAACGGPDGPNKADTGLVVGAVAGGLLGHTVGGGSGKVAATALGVFAGGIIGNEIGRSMDRQDRLLAQQAELDALERGQPGERVTWRNPENGRYGEVVPAPEFRRGPQRCREYVHTVYMRGRPEAMRGTACRNPDGTWTAVG